MDATRLKVSAGVRLDINRDSEYLNQFVRTNTDEVEINEADQRDPLKLLTAHKTPPPPKLTPGRKTKEHKKVEFQLREPEKQEVQKSLSQEEPSLEAPKDDNEDETKEDEAAPKEAKEKKPRSKLNQKQMYQELKKKKKKRKRRPKPEEFYTDKDRAAAVNMGSRDIKQSLRIKRKEDRSRILQMPEEAEPTTFLALGKAEMSRKRHDIALTFFHKALELNSTEKHSLVARSKCYILLGQPENGLQDAETALSIDKNFIKAIYQKAEALYYLGDFEHSLMYYHRGLRIRPEHEGFQLGVHKAQKAIENALGGCFPNLKISGDSVISTTRKSSSRQDVTETPSSPEETKSASGSKKSVNSATSTRGNPPRAKTGKRGPSRLLRELKTDKDYLDHLLNHPDIKCKNKEDNSEVIGYIQEAVDFLNKRQEFWRQQLPNSRK